MCPTPSLIFKLPCPLSLTCTPTCTRKKHIYTNTYTNTSCNLSLQRMIKCPLPGYGEATHTHSPSDTSLYLSRCPSSIPQVGLLTLNIYKVSSVQPKQHRSNTTPACLVSFYSIPLRVWGLLLTVVCHSDSRCCSAMLPTPSFTGAH